MRQTEKTAELSIMKYIAIAPQSQSVGMSCLQNALFVTVRSERDLSAAVLFAKITCIERLEEVTLIFSKYISTLLPIILSGDRLQFVMPGQTRTRVSKSQTKSIKESMRVHELEAKRQREFQFSSTVIKT